MAEITATLYLDKSAVTSLISHPLDGDYIVVDLRLVPRGEKPLSVLRDDFLLRSDRDGQKCQPFAPSQIAGQGTSMVSSTGSGGALMGDNNGPIWGGTVGQPGAHGRQRRLHGKRLRNFRARHRANGRQDEIQSHASGVETEDIAGKGNPRTRLGLLYFFLEGKHSPRTSN